MSKLTEIINQSEGRRLEFKVSLPSKSDLAKSIIAFANDAGGEFYLGIQDNPHEVIGLEEESLIALEEKISNIIHDQCTPVILPGIMFLNYEGKHILVVKIHKGNTPPYYLRSKGIENGTYIRVGSTNRQASPEIIAELERQKHNISFDSELVYRKTADEIDLQSFRELFLEKAGEKLTKPVLSKLDLYKTEQGKELPTNAMILLSDDELRKQIFPYAKIECARFKGTVPGNFIDQKTIDVNVGLQAELAYQFVQRHISQGTTDCTGVYRNDRWEFPVIAIREVIRNAVIHRDYSLSGKDIKIAIFDDKIEITSPGKLMPSVDFSDMESGQSDIRNKALAPVFKKLGIIEQWGNGLRIIAEELQPYPEIAFSWNEPGIAFRVIFANKNYEQQHELQQGFEKVLIVIGTKLGLSRDQVGTKLGPSWDQVISLLDLCREPQSVQSLMGLVHWTNRTKFRNKYINLFLIMEYIQMTVPSKPNSSKQKYIITEKGNKFLKFIKGEK
ncbi:MAG: ATP-dependent DNA helicase [Bacteroidales bacterium]|nr:ATP-dependent DNA helicase [Bacteroidales bacterium]